MRHEHLNPGVAVGFSFMYPPSMQTKVHVHFSTSSDLVYSSSWLAYSKSNAVRRSLP